MKQENSNRNCHAAGAVMDVDLLRRAVECWQGWRGFRQERDRCKRFTYGDQWIDSVEDSGVRVREEELIRRQGNMPLKNNLIRRLVRNVLGVFRNRYHLPDEPALLQNALENRLEEVYARSMEEFLISGLVVHKKWYGRRGATVGCRTDIVAPDAFFADLASRDFRGLDVSMIGEIHEIRYRELESVFCQSEADKIKIRSLYGIASDAEEALCAVVEVWELHREVRFMCHDSRSGRWWIAGESPAAEPGISVERRVSDSWHYAFLTPDGYILRKGRSPYPGGRHPYVFRAYPFIDGEIHSFVSDVIDQQKLTNRLISMYDWILRASAKGVLLFPEGALPEGVDMADIAEEWSRFNGVIVYRPRAGVPLPQQVSSKSADIGITELLEIQMKMMEDISGVNGALQGKLDSNSMSGTLYNQQTQNSLTAMADLMKSFDDFIGEATARDAENLRHFGS